MNETDDLRAENAALRKRIQELEQLLVTQQALTGMVHICASCKKVHKEDDAWIQIEAFIRELGDVQFTHGLCPDCHKKLETE